MSSRLARWLGGLLLAIPVAVSAAEFAPTISPEKTGLIPRKVLFGNPDKAGRASAPTAEDQLSRSRRRRPERLGRARSTSPATPSRSPRTRSAASARTSGPTPTSTSSTSRTQDGDENWHVYARRSDVRRDQGPHAAQEGQRASIDEVSHKFPNEILIGLNDRDPQLSRRLSRQPRHRRAQAGPEERRVRRLHHRRRLPGPLRHQVHARRRHGSTSSRTARTAGTSS